jgi:putative membrane-bound dehydrogenase-like protein
MRIWAIWLGLLILPALVAMPLAATAADDEGFEPIFDGKSLEGWDGNPDFWSVKDGAIIGQTTADKPTRGNTFLIWRKGEVGDFELKCQYKIVGGNSGIQYRSFEVPNEKWVVGGYQADIDSGDTYSGINYGERFRGILANRGQKTVVKRGADGKVQVEVAGSVGDSKEIQSKIKKEDWNDYHIVAKGFTFEHRINGVVTSICTDEDAKERRAKGIIALQLHAGPPMTVQFRNIRLKRLDAAKQGTNKDQAQAAGQGKKIVFVAGRPSHAYGDHEHNAGCTLLAKELKAAMPEYETVVQLNGWPQDESIFDRADCIVMYCDGGGGHMAIPHLKQVDELAKKGVGIVCIHYAVEVPKGEVGDKFLEWIGGYFEMHWSVNPHWTAKFEKLPDHPIARGVPPFEINDEWYYHMRFRPEMKGVTPILTAMPPKETLSRPDGGHSGNPHVRAAIARGEPQHVAWAAERAGGGRGFGFTGGHFHWNWGDPNFRKVMLNAIVWCAHGEVPTAGVESPPVTLADLEANQDQQPPPNFDREAVRKRLKLPPDNGGQAAPRREQGTDTSPTRERGKALGERPVRREGGRNRPAFASPIVSMQTEGHAVEIDADITGANELFLVVTDGGDGFGCDWADWGQPRLVGPAGEKRLTDFKWKSAQTQFGNVQLNKNCTGGPLKIAGQEVSFGIGTHANSVIAFDLPEGFTRFKARAGLDNGGTDQGCGSTVQFFVFTQQPPARLIAGSPADGSSVSRKPEDAVAGLDVADGLEATLFASEPQISNITNIDIDHLGRVWACEVKNYRKHAGSRPEGDRILVLEDTNGDGAADKTTVFYQGRDIDSVHGICVLGSRVIVSAGDRVQVFYDENGDLKADEKRDLLFTGISGTQHDHGIHAFVFGPDGKLYFNFGNSGNQLKDKHGKIVVDQAGNEVVANRKPYQEGMVFRCNLDGSGVETLGWNFRNNWEVAVDSFGTLWQSDNDDDGNKGVRINYVMEFGNYGYKDEITGAGWQTPRENLEREIPERHWHLNDPGVVPTLLLTGAGSPTGICVYEGTLLPKVFHNQVIHCDAGPNVVRAYVTQKHGAGYKAEMVNILHGARDNWFRPSDVCVAPDGSLFVADWYDPGVGGHNQQEVDRGRIFRVAPPAVKYRVPESDFATVEGCLKALENPNQSVRYRAVTSLVAMADQAHHPVEEAIEKASDPRLKARLLWVLAQMPGEGEEAVEMGAHDRDPDIRVTAIRIAQRLGLDTHGVAALAKDSAPEVRRELAIALRQSKSSKAPEIWAELAAQHDGKDRWYLEALGIGAEGKWDACLEAYLKKVASQWNTPAGRDIIWRSRAKQSADLLVQILKDPATTEEQQPRYLRALDFLAGPEKERALEKLLE